MVLLGQKETFGQVRRHVDHGEEERGTQEDESEEGCGGLDFAKGSVPDAKEGIRNQVGTQAVKHIYIPVNIQHQGGNNGTGGV